MPATKKKESFKKIGIGLSKKKSYHPECPVHGDPMWVPVSASQIRIEKSSFPPSPYSSPPPLTIFVPQGEKHTEQTWSLCPNPTGHVGLTPSRRQPESYVHVQFGLSSLQNCSKSYCSIHLVYLVHLLLNPLPVPVPAQRRYARASRRLPNSDALVPAATSNLFAVWTEGNTRYVTVKCSIVSTHHTF